MTHRDFPLALIWNSIEKAVSLPYFSVLGKTSVMYKQSKLQPTMASSILDSSSFYVFCRRNQKMDTV
jgi:hypothetical protein